MRTRRVATSTVTCPMPGSSARSPSTLAWHFLTGDVGRGQLGGDRVYGLAPSTAVSGAVGVAVTECGADGCPGVWPKRRSRSALPTTVTELVAIATAASTGGRMPVAASGTRIRL